MKTRIHVVQGDITKLAVDVIVNAANPSLMGGGGVDGAIHRAAGPALLDACLKVRQQQGDCPTGHAVITLAGDLPAKAVVHTVGPVWRGGEQNEDQLLQDAYLNSLLPHNRCRGTKKSPIILPSRIFYSFYQNFLNYF